LYRCGLDVGSILLCLSSARDIDMKDVVTIGLDLAKSVFQVHGADRAGNAVLTRALRRAQVLDFFSRLAVVHIIGHARSQPSGTMCA
jgi:hypothetical protein